MIGERLAWCFMFALKSIKGTMAVCYIASKYCKTKRVTIIFRKQLYQTG